MSSADIPVRVSRVETVAERIKKIRFVPVDGQPLPTFSAGAHTVVTMRSGEKTIKNPYSLMGAIGDTSGYEISVLRVRLNDRFHLDLLPHARAGREGGHGREGRALRDVRRHQPTRDLARLDLGPSGDPRVTVRRWARGDRVL